MPDINKQKLIKSVSTITAKLIFFIKKLLPKLKINKLKNYVKKDRYFRWNI